MRLHGSQDIELLAEGTSRITQIVLPVLPVAAFVHWRHCCSLGPDLSIAAVVEPATSGALIAAMFAFLGPATAFWWAFRVLDRACSIRLSQRWTRRLRIRVWRLLTSGGVPRAMANWHSLLLIAVAVGCVGWVGAGLIAFLHGLATWLGWWVATAELILYGLFLIWAIHRLALSRGIDAYEFAQRCWKKLMGRIKHGRR